VACGRRAFRTGGGRVCGRGGREGWGGEAVPGLEKREGGIYAGASGGGGMLWFSLVLVAHCPIGNKCPGENMSYIA